MAFDFDYHLPGQQTVTALFESAAEADKARSDLMAAGFSPDAIVTSSGVDHAGSAAGSSQSIVKSLLDIFIFMPPHEKPTYEEAMRRGGVAIAVRTDVASYERAIDILDRDGALDLDERETEWKAEGWTPDPAAPRPGGPGSADQAAFEASNSHDPLVNPDANRDVRERIGVGTSDVTVGMDMAPPSAASPAPVAQRDLGHGRTRVRSYTSGAAEMPAGIDPRI